MSTIAIKELEDLKVVQSNDLIRASCKLTKRALILIYFILAKIDSINQDTFTDFLLSYSQIVAILNYDWKRRISKRSEVLEIVTELNKAPIFWEDEEDAVSINWLSSMTHHKKADLFRLRIDPLLKPHLLALRDNFTMFLYTSVYSMEPTSTGFYLLMKSYHHRPGTITKIFKIDELKFRLWLQGKYKKFYELKRRVLSPALKELMEFTDLISTYEIHEKVGKTVLSLKFTIKDNKKVAGTLQGAVEQTEAVKALIDPLAMTKVYQALIIAWVSMNRQATSIAKKCVDDEAYREIVLDTISRCEKYFQTNASIRNRSGYIIKAITEDYFKDERAEEQRKAQLRNQEQEKKKLEAEITLLVEKGKQRFEERRWPKLQEIRGKYLNDEHIEQAIKKYAPGEMIYRKVLAKVQAGDQSAIAENRINDYLVDRYLDESFKNLDVFLAKNYSLKKTDSGYQLMI